MKKYSLISFSVFLAILMYDLFVVITKGVPSSISQLLADVTFDSELCLCGVTVLATHFFGWVMVPKRSARGLVMRSIPYLEQVLLDIPDGDVRRVELLLLIEQSKIEAAK